MRGENFACQNNLNITICEGNYLLVELKIDCLLHPLHHLGEINSQSLRLYSSTIDILTLGIEVYYLHILDSNVACSRAEDYSYLYLCAS